MASFDYSRLRAEGQAALDAAGYSPKKTVMVHSGVTVGLGLLLSVLTYLLDMGIAQTGGLGGIGTRTVLETVQSLLETVNMLLLPFWSIGYIRTVLHWTHREPAGLGTLLSGFRFWGPVLRLMFLQGMVYLALGFVGAYAGSAVFMLTPGAQTLLQVVQEMEAAGITDPYAMMESEAYLAATAAMAPYCMGAAALVIAPVAYRLRFAQFALMEEPRMGGLLAMVQSWRLTRKNCLALLKLDLRVWWYHLAGALIAVLGYGDMLLGLAGIELGISADAAMFVFYIAALVCEFGLYVWRKNQVCTVYALAYTQLKAAKPEPTKPQTQPKNLPWNT